jgi:hypothetical protein
MVGFITLFGIATRNGHHDGFALHPPDEGGGRALRRGDDRAGHAGAPAARTDDGAGCGPGDGAARARRGPDRARRSCTRSPVVILGGLVTATLLDQIVTPALFLRFGRKEWENYVPGSAAHDDEDITAEDYPKNGSSNGHGSPRPAPRPGSRFCIRSRWIDPF